MSLPKSKTRTEQIQALASTVDDFGDGFFTVAASDDSGWKYLCYPDALTPTCNCIDHRRKRTTQPSYQCKHLEAIALFLKAKPKAPPSIKQNLLSMQHYLARVAKRQVEAKAAFDRLNEIPLGLSMIEA